MLQNVSERKIFFYRNRILRLTKVNKHTTLQGLNTKPSTLKISENRIQSESILTVLIYSICFMLNGAKCVKTYLVS